MVRYEDVESYQEFQRTLNQPSEEPWTTICKALYYTAARERELMAIAPDDINWDETDNTFLNVKIHTLKNKRSKVRLIPINKVIEPQAIELFLAAKQSPACPEFAFYNTANPLESFLRKLRRRTNELYNGVAPHFFRHCRLTHCITKFNFTDYDLKQYAGWTDVRPGSYYVHLRVQNLQSKMR